MITHPLRRISKLVFSTAGMIYDANAERCVYEKISTRPFQSHQFHSVGSPWFGENRLGNSSKAMFYFAWNTVRCLYGFVLLTGMCVVPSPPYGSMGTWRLAAFSAEALHCGRKVKGWACFPAWCWDLDGMHDQSLCSKITQTTSYLVRPWVHIYLHYVFDNTRDCMFLRRAIIEAHILFDFVWPNMVTADVNVAISYRPRPLRIKRCRKPWFRYPRTARHAPYIHCD